MKNDMYYQTDTDTSRNKNISFLKLSYGNFVSLDDYVVLEKENQQLKQELQQKEDIIYKIKKCIEEKEEYYGDYMGDGNYTMYSMMGANNNRIPYIKSNLIKQILDNKGE